MGYNAPGGGGGASGLTLIQRQVLVAAAASVNFAAIPATFENLVLEIVARMDAAANADLLLQFNGDTAAHYDYQSATGQNATAGALQGVAQTAAIMGEITGTGAAANQPNVVRIIVPAYAGTTFNKVCRYQAGTVLGVTSGSFIAQSGFGNWRSNAAIASLLVSNDGGDNFVAGSRFSLYGES